MAEYTVEDINAALLAAFITLLWERGRTKRQFDMAVINFTSSAHHIYSMWHGRIQNQCARYQNLVRQPTNNVAVAIDMLPAYKFDCTRIVSALTHLSLVRT